MFLKDQKNNLTPNEQNNEVNRFVGWAVFSSLKRILKKKASGKDSSKAKASDRDHRALLMSMMVRARDIDDEYTSKYYDSNMSLLNRGGLTFVSKLSFPWSKQLMNSLRCEFNLHTLDRDPRNGFKTSKMSIIANGGLRTEFFDVPRIASPYEII